MPDVVQTETMLIGLMPDNNVGFISASTGRSWVVSLFGWDDDRDPTANDDAFNSGGTGQFFDLKSRWFNRLTQVEWICWSGRVGMAIWQPAWNGVPPTPPPARTVIGTVDVGPVAVTVSPPAGLGPYSGITLYDGESCLAIGSLNPVDDGPWIAHAGPWVRPAWYANGQTVFGTVVVQVAISSLGVGWKANLLYLLNPVTAGEFDQSWVVGTDVPFQQTANIGSLQVTSSDGSMTIVGSVNPFPHRLDYDNTCDISVQSVDGSLVSSPIPTSSLPASFNESGITFILVTLGSTPYTLEVDTISGDLYFIDGGGTPQKVQTGGGGFTPVSLSGTASSVSLTTVFDQTASNCFMANLAISNTTPTSPGFINMRVTVYDAWGDSFASSLITVNGGNKADIVNVASDSVGNGVYLPLTRVKVEVATDNASFPQTWQIKGAVSLL